MTLWPRPQAVHQGAKSPISLLSSELQPHLGMVWHTRDVSGMATVPGSWVALLPNRWAFKYVIGASWLLPGSS